MKEKMNLTYNFILNSKVPQSSLLTEKILLMAWAKLEISEKDQISLQVQDKRVSIILLNLRQMLIRDPSKLHLYPVVDVKGDGGDLNQNHARSGATNILNLSERA